MHNQVLLQTEDKGQIGAQFNTERELLFVFILCFVCKRIIIVWIPIDDTTNSGIINHLDQSKPNGIFMTKKVKIWKI